MVIAPDMPTTRGGTAVMARRRSPADSLDFFPTPPWATRALFPFLDGAVCWEPAAGEGHMAEVLREYFDDVLASDVHDYGKGYEVGSYVGTGADVLGPRVVDWIVTNPPFNLAVEFAERALTEATSGVALLVRTSWLESRDRFARLFSERPPAIVALFCERVPMVKGRWDPKASSATSYSWVIWRRRHEGITSRLVWIPPGRKQALTKTTDVDRFAGRAA